MKHKLILLLLILIILLVSGCVDIEKCEEAARVDYNMEHPQCTHWLFIRGGWDCSCVEKICSKLSCEEDYPEYFNLIE